MTSTRSRIRQRLWGEPIPEYQAVGLAEPQTEVDVRLTGAGVEQEVTGNNVLVSLRPLTVALGLPGGSTLAAAHTGPRTLYFCERGAGDRWLGRIHLRQRQTLTLPQGQVGLFETAGSENRCLPAPHLWRFYWERWRRSRQQRFNFRMRTSELRAQYVFYICPRPVVLVTVVAEAGSNLFPMDLIGPTRGGDFLLALRSTSPAIRLIDSSRRLALSSMSLAATASVYALGKHHRQEGIDWDALPFGTRPSVHFGLPVPTPALAVREVRVEQIHVIGSHTVFVTQPVHAEVCGAGSRLFHVSGLYQAYRRGQGRPL